MSRFHRLVTSVRVWLLLVFVILSIIAINMQFSSEGVAIRQIVKGSSAAVAGLQNPSANVAPTLREMILEVNGVPVNDVVSYYAAVNAVPAEGTVRITTTKNTYVVPVRANINTTTNKTIGPEDIGVVVREAPQSNIRLGLDLSGGTRVILKPEHPVPEQDLTLIIDNIKERLNVYGLSDIIVRDARDLSGQDFIVVEIAGANKDEVRDLLSNQGKFAAAVGDTTVFRGGNDITYVCRTAECSGLDRNAGCGTTTGGWACRFSFEIQLSPEAAQRQADATRNLDVVYNESAQGYLSEPLHLYLDDVLVDTLQISPDLKGRAATSILISGSGFGSTQQAASEDAISNMRTLQTVLVTGSLPVKLEIVKTDGISPALGSEFVRNAIMIMGLSILAVAIVVAVRYRKPIISIPVMITMLSEVLIILGFAALTGWNLDLAAIAAIIIAIGSGVDDQIVIMDETLSGVKEERSWKDRMKSAFFIIFASYFTLAAAMVPLFFAGAGLLRGFAITTLVGVTAGVLITRPAFARFVEILFQTEEE